MSTEIDAIGAKFRAKSEKFPPKKSGGVAGARDKSKPCSCLRCGSSADHSRGNCPAINSVLNLPRKDIMPEFACPSRLEKL